jgi:Fe-S oxidoreductase
MCPSYMVTREEEHSTRGRSRLLFEMLEGHADSPVTGGWRHRPASPGAAVRPPDVASLACPARSRPGWAARRGRPVAGHIHQPPDPAVGQAAVEVLEAAGWRVIVPDQPLCCGLTWISTGQLATARRVLQRTVDALSPHLRRGTKIVGLEPSCTAVFRSDARELMPGNRDVERLGEQTVTLAELLTHHTDGWQPPQVGGQAIAQTHCHQHAIMGYDEDKALLRAAGIDLDVLDAGCCGLGGNFGFEAGHYDVSMACGERALLPAVRDAAEDVLVLADGFSCRTQIEQGGTGRTPVHLAEVLAAGLHGEPVRPSRPAPPGAADYLRLVGLAAAGASAAAAVAAAAVRRRR